MTGRLSRPLHRIDIEAAECVPLPPAPLKSDASGAWRAWRGEIPEVCRLVVFVFPQTPPASDIAASFSFALGVSTLNEVRSLDAYGREFVTKRVRS